MSLTIQINSIEDVEALAVQLQTLNKKYFDRGGSGSKYRDMSAELANCPNGFQQAKAFFANNINEATPLQTVASLSIYVKSEYTEELDSPVFTNTKDLKNRLKREIMDKLDLCAIDSYETYLEVRVPRESFSYPAISIEDGLQAWFDELVERNSAEDLISYLNILPPSDSNRDS